MERPGLNDEPDTEISGDNIYAQYTPEQWKHLYEEVYPMVLNMILEHKGPYDWAKEICHDAFLIYFRKCTDKNFTLTCKPSTFLVAIARKIYLNRLRKEKRKLSHAAILTQKESEREAVPDLSHVLHEQTEYEMNLRKMEQSMNQLGEPCRELLLDFYVRNLSMLQIAEKFGYTNADNAKSQKYKCLQRLKKFFFNSTQV